MQVSEHALLGVETSWANYPCIAPDNLRCRVEMTVCERLEVATVD
jgi:hypothetical protein